VALFALLLCGTSAYAHQFDLSANDNALRASCATEVGDGLRLDGGWLHDSDEGDLIHAGFQITGEASPGGQSLDAGVGVRLAYLDGEGRDRQGYGLGVGGTLRWILPRTTRWALDAEAYFAPDVLTGGDADQYTDATIRLSYAVTDRAGVYLGARYAGADYDDRPSIRFDTGLHLGIRLTF
jgi:opacity protein-like surface antigen